MTITNTIKCDRCGVEVNPPENKGWLALMVTGPDGMTAVDSDGHLCRGCRGWLKTELKGKRIIQ